MAKQAKKQPAIDNGGNLEMVAISEIYVGPRLRKVDPVKAAALAERFRAEGMQSPIQVCGPDEHQRYRLIFGEHRLQAHVLNKLSAIEAIVKPQDSFVDEAAYTLAEIAENMERFDLNALERAVNIAAWRDVYNLRNGKAKPGPKARLAANDEGLEELSANFALNFTEAAQNAFDLSRRSIFLALKIASIEDDVREDLALHPVASRQSDLLTIAAEGPKRQRDIAALLLNGKADTATAAIVLLDNLPPPKTTEPWQRITNGFSALKPSDQERFFSFLRPAFERWLAERS